MDLVDFEKPQMLNTLWPLPDALFMAAIDAVKDLILVV